MIRAQRAIGDTGGHYQVAHDRYTEQITALHCLHLGCAYAATRIQHHRGGDRSGLGRYNRMRAAMMRHWRDCHPLTDPKGDERQGGGEVVGQQAGGPARTGRVSRTTSAREKGTTK